MSKITKDKFDSFVSHFKNSQAVGWVDWDENYPTVELIGSIYMGHVIRICNELGISTDSIVLTSGVDDDGSSFIEVSFSS